MWAKIAKYIAVFLLVLSCCSTVYAQSKAKKIKDIRQQAEAAMQRGDYPQASQLWGYLLAETPKDATAQMQLAIAQVETGSYAAAVQNFAALPTKMQALPLSLYYLGRAAQAQQRDDEAAQYFRRYLGEAEEKNIEATKIREDVKIRLRQLPQAFTLMLKLDFVAFATPLGAPLSSAGDDYGLMPTPEANIWGYSSSGQMQRAKLENGRWTAAPTFEERYQNKNQNIADNTALMGFCDGGYQIVYQRNDSVWIDNYDGEPQPLAVPFELQRFATWLGDFQFFEQNLLIFAAESREGYGKKDIYWSQWQKEQGRWSEANNMGQGINTAYDERSPFLAADGRTLYFSRHAPESMGGFDIYTTVFNDATLAWSPVRRLPAPINSAADDLFFYPQPDGMTAYLSSRRAPTLGSLDFYSIAFLEALPSQKKQVGNFAQTLLAPSFLQVQPPTVDSLTEAKSDSSSEQKPVRYTLYPIFYESSLTAVPSVARNLATLTELLNAAPNTELIISAHSSTPAQNQAYSLFLSLKQAESFAQELVAAGIAASRIRLRGFGTLSPLARKILTDASLSPQAARLNQRIILDVVNTAQLPYIVKNQPITVSELLRPDTETNYAPNDKGLCFKIRLHSSNSIWQHKILEQNLQLSIEQQPNTSIIDYLCGQYPQYQSAKNMRDNLAAQYDLPNAEILPYLNGWPLNDAQAQALVAQYPELKNYLSSK
jgi:outer membrane protein OmpA-like peptidoglycan-associated protein